MKDWWDNLQSREQNFVLIASVVVVLFLLYLLAWSPLVKARDNKRIQVESNQQLLTWMTTKSNEVKQLKLTNPNLLKSGSKRSLLAIVDGLAKQLGLRTAIKRIEPDGPHAATIWIEEMNFDALIALLGQLDKRSNVKVKQADVTRLDKPGVVKAKVVLKRS